MKSTSTLVVGFFLPAASITAVLRDTSASPPPLVSTACERYSFDASTTTFSAFCKGSKDTSKPNQINVDERREKSNTPCIFNAGGAFATSLYNMKYGEDDNAHDRWREWGWDYSRMTLNHSCKDCEIFADPSQDNAPTLRCTCDKLPTQPESGQSKITQRLDDFLAVDDEANLTCKNKDM